MVASGTVQPCPAATPFLDSTGKCITCPTLFDVNTKKCTTCPTGMAWHVETQKCTLDTATLITNPNTAPNLIVRDTPLGQYQAMYTATKNGQNPPTDCVAPTPYYNGVQCIQCQDPYKYFDM